MLIYLWKVNGELAKINKQIVDWQVGKANKKEIGRHLLVGSDIIRYVV